MWIKLSTVTRLPFSRRSAIRKDATETRFFSDINCGRTANFTCRHPHGLQTTLFRRRHFQVSGADLNSSSSSSHILILSSNCTFDNTVVLVVMFITSATLKITELNSLNWTETTVLGAGSVLCLRATLCSKPDAVTGVSTTDNMQNALVCRYVQDTHLHTCLQAIELHTDILWFTFPNMPCHVELIPLHICTLLTDSTDSRTI